MGQVLICACGYIKIWQGVVHSSENSQHLFDWYTFSHIIHGLAFYAILSKAAAKRSVGERLVIATSIEAAWEIFENTPLIINRYRQTALSLEYFGDSVINSTGDIFSMTIGFLLAAKFPVWASACLVIFLELFTAYFIRDNLTLNIITLIHPFEFIGRWQGGN